jgi:hypothetical protein
MKNLIIILMLVGLFPSSINFIGNTAAFGQTRTILTTFTGVTYGTGYIPKHSGCAPESVTLFDTTACQWLYNGANAYAQNDLWQMAYDTAKKHLETCPSDFGNTAHDFGIMTQAMQNLGSTPELKAAYLAFLKSVLYYDTIHPEYFCKCVEAMEGAVPIPKDTMPGAGSRATNYGLAVVRWLILNTTCDTPGLRIEYNQSRQSQWEL